MRMPLGKLGAKAMSTRSRALRKLHLLSCFLFGFSHTYLARRELLRQPPGPLLGCHLIARRLNCYLMRDSPVCGRFGGFTRLIFTKSRPVFRDGSDAPFSTSLLFLLVWGKLVSGAASEGGKNGREGWRGEGDQSFESESHGLS
jgi:hypothetical protein